jgi:hypothetical protein
VGEILSDFSGNREPVTIFYIKINENFIFDLRIFTSRTVFIERITFVNRRMGVHICCAHSPLNDGSNKKCSIEPVFFLIYEILTR